MALNNPFSLLSVKALGIGFDVRYEASYDQAPSKKELVLELALMAWKFEKRILLDGD